MSDTVVSLLYRVQFRDFNAWLVNSLLFDFHILADAVTLHHYKSMTGNDTHTGIIEPDKVG